MRPPIARLRAVALAAFLLGGCGTTAPSWNPMNWSIPAPSLDWLTGRGSQVKPGPLPALTATANPALAWQASVGKAGPGLAPAITADAIYAAATDGSLARFERETGRQVWRIAAGKPVHAGPGADASLVVVGTDKGEVLAFDANGKSLWTATVSSEVLSPPIVADGVVVVASGDGRIHGLGAADGKTKWLQQRINPPLTVRNTAGGVASRGGAFLGLPGGRLLAMDLQTGTIGWDGAVAIPTGATELERIADVVSRPLVEERQTCAVAFQGRLACFEIVRGGLLWTRDVSSLAGVAADAAAYYVVDDKGAVHAFDKSTGASLWKQEVLAERRLRAAQVIGDQLAVLDVEGYVHALAKPTGAYVGRLATDGSAPTGQPFAVGDRIVWQSLNGTLYAATAR
ncbi:MAG: outer membrane protein assembly factor BamB [Betaproteobacteria bacterium]|jgi:outer membrane protein assembly factor BamB|nr:outer membrane protein assembly factor BamB [Betaproteobacteria bacterium]